MRAYVENLLSAFYCELGRKSRSLLPTELAVVLPARLERPAVSVGDCQPNVVLVERLLKRTAIDGPRIGKRGIDLVAERLLEAARLELFAPQLPIGFRPLGRGKNPKTLFRHEVVVELPEPVLPGCEPLEALVREVVVVQDEDMGVPMSPRGVAVDGDEVVRGVHPFNELHRDVPDAVEVLLYRNIKLVGVKREDIGLKFNLASVGTREHLRAGGERLRCLIFIRDRDRERSGPVPLHSVMTVEQVGHRRGRVPGRSNVDSTHVTVRSPSAARTSSTREPTS